MPGENETERTFNPQTDLDRSTWTPQKDGTFWHNKENIELSFSDGECLMKCHYVDDDLVIDEKAEYKIALGGDAPREAAARIDGQANRWLEKCEKISKEYAEGDLNHRLEEYGGERRDHIESIAALHTERKSATKPRIKAIDRDIAEHVGRVSDIDVFAEENVDDAKDYIRCHGGVLPGEAVKIAARINGKDTGKDQGQVMA